MPRVIADTPTGAAVRHGLANSRQRRFCSWGLMAYEPPQMQTWEKIGTTLAVDGTLLELRKRGHEYRLWAGGGDLMSSDDEGSSRALAELGCAHMDVARKGRVLVGGLGMGYTLRAALDHTGAKVTVEIAELVPGVVEWNRGPLAALAGRPLDDTRAELVLEDVRLRIGASARGRYDAILLDVDNGPHPHAHLSNDGLYSGRGLARAWDALRVGGVLGVWSISDDPRFTARLKRHGFEVDLRRVEGSRKGRGRRHLIWLARRPAAAVRGRQRTA
jgi:spermidine synthase